MGPYLQSTEYTTAAASLVYILHELTGQIQNTWIELDIWRSSALLPTRASSIYGLANYCAKQGLKATIIIQKKQYSFPDYRFFRYKKTDIDIAKDMQDYYQRQSVILNIPIIKQKIDVETIKSYSKQIMLVRLNPRVWRGTTTSNFVVVKPINEHFIIMDPAIGQFCITAETLQQALNDLQDKKKREPQLLVLQS